MLLEHRPTCRPETFLEGPVPSAQRPGNWDLAELIGEAGDGVCACLIVSVLVILVRLGVACCLLFSKHSTVVRLCDGHQEISLTSSLRVQESLTRVPHTCGCLSYLGAAFWFIFVHLMMLFLSQ